MVAAGCYKPTVNESETIKAAQGFGVDRGLRVFLGRVNIPARGFPAMSPVERS
jgi:hypothetical protein